MRLQEFSFAVLSDQNPPKSPPPVRGSTPLWRILNSLSEFSAADSFSS